MSAPTVERTRSVAQARPAGQPGPSRHRGAPGQWTASRPGGSGQQGAPRRSGGVTADTEARSAIRRAYARRAVRERRLVGEENPAAGRTQFVLLIMVLFAAGLVASLWLSTTAATDSYRLDGARRATRDLTERSEALRSEIASMQSPPALAEAAQRMDMVQISDAARLVLAPDGSVRVVGVAKPAVAPPPPPASTPPASPAGQPGAGRPPDASQALAAQPQSAGQQGPAGAPGPSEAWGQAAPAVPTEARPQPARALAQRPEISAPGGTQPQLAIAPGTAGAEP